MLQSLISPFYSSKLKLWYQEGLFEKKYPRMDQVKLVEDSIKKIWNLKFLGRPYHFSSKHIHYNRRICSHFNWFVWLNREKREQFWKNEVFWKIFFWVLCLHSSWLVYEWFPGNFVQPNDCKRDFNHELSKMCVQMSWWSTPIMMLTSLQ